jgi:magnesium-transporting ATPase (P-type)
MELEYFEDLPLDSLYENLLKSKKFCFLGMAGIVEPPLIGVEAAVLRAEQAGIRLFLVTGDHPRNAEVLARQIGFYNQNSTISTTSFGSLESLNTSSTSYEMSDKSSGSLVQLPIVLHGDNLNEMNEQEWSVILKHRRVIFARITPVQKVELIKASYFRKFVNF